jgi:hypothetical protein
VIPVVSVTSVVKKRGGFMRILITLLVLCMVSAIAVPAAQPTSLAAFHRSGQTFITWGEDEGQSGETYRIYRHSVYEQKEGSSYFREMHNCSRQLAESFNCYIDRYIIQPVSSGKGTQLSATTGLFVYTALNQSSEDVYYAVTTVSSGGSEETTIGSGNSAGSVTEQWALPDAVRYLVETDRDYYILWLDYRIYDSYTGNAFPVAITKSKFTPGADMPSLHLDGIGTNFPGANYSNYGNTDYGSTEFGSNGTPTWYFGHHMSHQYDGGCQSTSGRQMQDTIANYIQYKHMQAVLWARRKFGITQQKFHINGNSMGASGAWGFIMTYPSFVTSIYSCEGLTQYEVPGINSRGDTIWMSSIAQNYGHYSVANPAKFLAFSNPDYPGMDWACQFTGMNVYDARNVVKFLKLNTYKSFGNIGGGHCFQDGSIPYEYQGAHFEEYIKDSRHTFGYGVKDGGHGWGQAMGTSRMNPHTYWNESRPGFSNVDPIEGCQYNDPAHERPGSRTYMSYVEWGVASRPLMNGKKIEETATSWSVPIINVSRCASKDYVDNVDITPRNLQTLEICEGDVFTYTVMDANETVEATGECTADSIQLVLIPDVPMRLTGAIAKIELKSRGSNYPCADLDPPIHKQTPVNIFNSVRGLKNTTHQSRLAVMPNPFTTTTFIELDIGLNFSARTTGEMRIYNLTGALVKRFHIQSRLLNTNRVAWNGRDMRGMEVPSGIYIVSVVVVGVKISRRLVLAR